MCSKLHKEWPLFQPESQTQALLTGKAANIRKADMKLWITLKMVKIVTVGVVVYQ